MNPSTNPRSGSASVITTFIDGTHLNGFIVNFSPIRDTCQIFPLAGPYAGESKLVNIRQIKGIFFVKEFIDLESLESDEFVGLVQDRKIEVIFTDGERLVGSTKGYDATRPGFFVIPAKSVGNILRIFVSNANVRQVRRVQLEKGKTEATRDDRRRRSPRVPLQAPIQVTWRNESGKPHAETTTTEVVNAHGALVTLRNPRVPGSELEVTNLATHIRARAQVVFAGSPSPQRGIEVGIELADPNQNFWMANSHG